MSFKNKVVLVTGGSSGIGAATAELFSKNGADVVIVGRNESKLRIVADRCSTLGCTPLTITADVSKEQDLTIIIEKTIEKYQQLDVLVNNAGIACITDLVDGDFLSKFDEVMSTNFRSAVVLTKLAIPHLIKTKGNIINMSSVMSTRFKKSQLAYGTSKAALDYFTKASATELAQFGVRVNCINPGYTRTDIMTTIGMPISTWDVLAPTTALGKVSEPEEIADMILYLASNKARSITGTSIIIDNGSSIVFR
ncbi:hypothetical protein O3G_MSEX010525 [Manduca sexta]|uniref:Uncharacterized protein n=1 Tax=Manduca sexta TaxID=7130 RepID=A0A921ZH08_MANSE|nr:hypothetical protein O3G_MSEX010525 [Manduca sexta]